MNISIIVAISTNNIIGKKNEIPWHLPADFKYFREKTTGHHIIMGRKTFDSIGRPLPNRTSIVITRQKDYVCEGCLIAHSLEEAINLVKENAVEDEVFIIGGKQIYDEALKIANKMYITIVHAGIDGDTSFPEYNKSDWNVISMIERLSDEKNIYNLTFLTLEKR